MMTSINNMLGMILSAILIYIKTNTEISHSASVNFYLYQSTTFAKM